jgi:hypothetical protein
MRWASGDGVSPSVVWQGRARPGETWSGRVQRGAARRGKARVADGGTEGFGLSCHPHKGGCSAVEHGAAWRGEARRGPAT